MILNELNQYFKDGICDIIGNDDNWEKESIDLHCKVCSTELEEEDCFKLYKEIGDDIYTMSFCYECAIVEEYATLFRAAKVEGNV